MLWERWWEAALALQNKKKDSEKQKNKKWKPLAAPTFISVSQKNKSQSFLYQDSMLQQEKNIFLFPQVNHSLVAHKPSWYYI